MPRPKCYGLPPTPRGEAVEVGDEQHAPYVWHSSRPHTGGPPPCTTIRSNGAPLINLSLSPPKWSCIRLQTFRYLGFGPSHLTFTSAFACRILSNCRRRDAHHPARAHCRAWARGRKLKFLPALRDVISSFVEAKSHQVVACDCKRKVFAIYPSLLQKDSGLRQKSLHSVVSFPRRSMAYVGTSFRRQKRANALRTPTSSNVTASWSLLLRGKRGG